MLLEDGATRVRFRLLHLIIIRVENANKQTFLSNLAIGQQNCDDWLERVYKCKFYLTAAYIRSRCEIVDDDDKNDEKDPLLLLLLFGVNEAAVRAAAAAVAV